MKMLLVEDEIRLAEYIKRGFAENGFSVDVAHSGLDGQHLALERNYDVIILDVMLPGIDGFAVLKHIRKSKRTPILMLTARGGLADRIQGLEEGADDYLGKPFAFTELLARVNALLRRSSMTLTEDEPVLRLADLELNLVTRRVTRSGQRLELTAKEFNLLTLLLRREGRPISRTQMAEQVWDMNFDSDTNVVEVAVRRLRAKVDDPFDHKLIHTVRGMGYVLEVRS